MRSATYRKLIKSINRNGRGRSQNVNSPTRAIRLFTAVSAFAAFLSALAAWFQATNFIRSERAEINIYPTQFSGGLIAGKPLQLSVEIKNGGKSAVHLKELVSVPRFDFELKGLPAVPEYNNQQRLSLAPVLPGGVSRIVVRIHMIADHPEQVIAQPFIDQINAEQIRFYYYGLLTYRDTFSWGDTTVGFCFQYDPGSRDAISFATCPEAAYTYLR